MAFSVPSCIARHEVRPPYEWPFPRRKQQCRIQTYTVLLYILVYLSSVYAVIHDGRPSKQPSIRAPKPLGSPGSPPEKKQHHYIASPKKRTTGILLNWKRPQHVHNILHTLKGQAELWVWNNGPPTFFPGADVTINSSQNLLSYPRWLMASLVRTEFIFVHDDDLLLDFRISECEKYMETLPADTILGVEGVKLRDGKGYWDGIHYSPNATGMVDVVKGRFIFLRSEFLQKVMLKNGPYTRGDDIYISSFSRHKELPEFMKIKELPTGSEGLSFRPEHMSQRAKAFDRYFNRKTSERKLGKIRYK